MNSTRVLFDVNHDWSYFLYFTTCRIDSMDLSNVYHAHILILLIHIQIHWLRALITFRRVNESSTSRAGSSLILRQISLRNNIPRSRSGDERESEMLIIIYEKKGRETLDLCVAWKRNRGLSQEYATHLRNVLNLHNYSSVKSNIFCTTIFYRLYGISTYTEYPVRSLE